MLVETALEDVAEVLELSGPVMKKVPATGAPSPVSAANTEILKLVMGVDELTNIGATVLKFAGCTKRRRMYLGRLTSAGF